MNFMEIFHKRLSDPLMKVILDEFFYKIIFFGFLKFVKFTALKKETKKSAFRYLVITCSISTPNHLLVQHSI